MVNTAEVRADIRQADKDTAAGDDRAYTRVASAWMFLLCAEVDRLNTVIAAATDNGYEHDPECGAQPCTRSCTLAPVAQPVRAPDS